MEFICYKEINGILYGVYQGKGGTIYFNEITGQ